MSSSSISRSAPARAGSSSSLGGGKVGGAAPHDPRESTSPFHYFGTAPPATVADDPMVDPSMMGPPFQTMPPDNDLGWMVGPAPVIGKNLVITVSRLLDMPVERSLFAGKKRYKVRIFDEREKELKLSNDISGVRQQDSPPGSDVETVGISPKEGMISVRTESPLLYIQVEHSGGMLGSNGIGRCQIHRLDPRSSQVWPYLLSDRDGVPVNCGIELQVQEENSGMPGSSVGPQGMMQMPGSQRKSQGPQRPSMQDMNHGVSALLEFEKVADMPYPRAENMRQVMLTVMSTDRDRELRRAGPFNARDQGSSLCRADCQRSRVFVQAPLHFGGDAEEGAMYIKIAVSYTNTSQKSQGGMELIGETDPIKVSWRSANKKYYEIRQKGSRNVLGGVYLTHRLMTEAEVAKQARQQADMPGRKAMPQVGPPIEPLHRVSGRTGNFPPGSPEEALEQAAINGEAQNRALLQRCKIADPTAHENDPHIRHVNGYREWDSLDSLFTTMGPNPLAMSEEVGPTVTRSYQESTSIMTEIAPNLGPAMTPADQKMHLDLIRMMYPNDPRLQQTALRPAVCKDPDEIAATKDMSWCPDPPVYAPLRNMREEDKETLRLSCFHPEQNAKLFFADANPNYRINEDIWGILADYKTTQSMYIPKQQTRHRRVKDDCLMA